MRFHPDGNRPLADAPGRGCFSLYHAFAVSVLLLLIAGGASAQDSSLPTLSGTPTITPATVDVSSDAQTVRVDAHLLDNVGVTLVIFSFKDAEGHTPVVDFPTLVSGTPADGVWRSDVYIPRSVNGVLTLNILAADAIFNILDTATTATLTVTGGDTEAPVVAGTASIMPVTVNLEAGPVDVTVTVPLRDDNSGVLYADAMFWSADSTDVASEYALLLDGDDHLGNWRAVVTIPQNTPPGNYQLVMGATDDAGNFEERVTGAMLHVAGGDTISPVLVGEVTVEPAAIDVSLGDGIVVVRATLADSSGVHSMGAELWDIDSNYVTSNSGALVLGTSHNGTWRAEVTIPGDTPTGMYRVIVTAEDEPGNYVELATGKTVTVTVNDAVPPTLVGEVTLQPDSVSVISGSAGVTVRAVLHDAQSGVSSVEARFLEPGFGIFLEGSLDRVLGDSLTGTWEGIITVPQNSTAGLYPLELWAEDAAGNSAVLAAGRTLRIGGGDVTAPALTGTTTLNPQSVDVSSGPQTVEARFALVDAGTGVAEVEAELRPIGPGEVLRVTAERLAGDEHTGEYRAIFTIQASSPEIVLALWVVAKDQAGNHADLQTDLLLQVRRFVEGRVTFRVDMRPLARPGIITPNLGTPVYVDLFDLSPPVVLAMTDANRDTVYEVQEYLPVGRDAHYAFAFSPGPTDTANWLYEKNGRSGGRTIRLDSGDPVILPIVTFDDLAMPTVMPPAAAVVSRGFAAGASGAEAFNDFDQYTDVILRQISAARPAAVGIRRHTGGAGGALPAGIATISTAAWWGVATYGPGAAFSASVTIPWDLTGGVLQPAALRWLHRTGPGAPWQVITAIIDTESREVRSASGPLDGEWTLGSVSDANSLVPTPPDTAAGPIPPDGAFIEETTVRFAWLPSTGAIEYDAWLWLEGTTRPAEPTFNRLTQPEFDLITPLAPLSQWRWQVAARNRAGTTLGPEWRFRVDNAPDLVVDQISAPTDVFAGQEVEVRWVIHNRGNQATNAARWFDGIYYSRDRDLNFRIDTFLGAAANGAWLAPGESYAGRTNVMIPAGETGESYLMIDADVFQQVAETDEANNLGSFAIHVRPGLKADLQLAGFTAPDRVFSGQSISLGWRVRNGGERAASGPWQDLVYLSPDSLLEPNRDLPLGAINRNESLAVDSAYVVAQSFSLPDTVIGDQYLIAVTDGINLVNELDEVVNNRRARPVTITLTPPPDLAPTALAAPTATQSSRPVKVRWTVQNQGPGAVNGRSWSDRVLLAPGAGASSDSTFVLGSFARALQLSPDSSYVDSALVRVPDGISGNWSLRLQSDWDNRIFEYQWESNNGYETGLSVTLSPSPDLRPRFGAPPAGVTAGDQLPLTWTIENAGADTARATWSNRLYISTEATWDSTRARMLAQDIRTADLAPGSSYSASPLVKIPPALAAGTWYFYLRADDDCRIYEHSGEGNNLLRSGPVNLLAYPVDLRVSDISGPTAALSGQMVTITWTVRNVGEGTTLVPNWIDRLWLSADTNLDPAADTKVGDVNHGGILGGGESYRRSVDIRIPHGIGGTFHLLVQADAGLAVIESDRSNNVGTAGSPIVVTLGPPADLVVESIEAPLSLAAGQSFVLTRQVRNAGVGVTPAAKWYDGVFLSKNGLRDREDITLRTILREGVLEPGHRMTESVSVSLPAYVSGNYYLIVQADSRDDVYEHEAEGNNLAFQLVTVDLPPPTDLVVKAVTVDSTASPGDSVTVNWILENRGTFLASGVLTDGLYMSADTLWTIEDPLVGLVERHVNIAGGATMALSARVGLANPEAADAEATTRRPLPGLAPGDYHAIVRANIRNTIRETDPFNNAGYSARRARIGMPLLPLDVLTPSTLAQGQWRYWRLDVPESGRTLVITLVGDEATSNELYVRFGEVPTRSQFDRRGDRGFSADQQVVIPGTTASSYYVMAYGDQVPGGPRPITLLAKIHQFEITAVEPAEAGQGGPVTLKVTGSGIVPGVQLALVHDAARLTPAKQYWFDATTLYATFDLAGAAAGDYSLEAHQVDARMVRTDDPDQVIAVAVDTSDVSLPAALRVVSPTLRRMDIRRSGPRIVRITQGFEMVVEATNLSNQDMRAPLLLVYGLPDYLKGLDGGNARSRGARLFLVPAPEGPAGIYPPGATGRLDIAGTAPGSPSTVEIEIEAVEESRYPFDLDHELRLIGVDPSAPEWSEAVQALRARGLANWNDYADLLAETATRQGFGVTAPREGEELLMLTLEEARRRILYPNLDDPIVPPSSPAAVGAEAVIGGAPPAGQGWDESPLRSESAAGPDCSVETLTKQTTALDVVVGIFVGMCAPGGAYHLGHYLHGDGSPLSYGTGSYVAVLVRAHNNAARSFKEIHRDVAKQLREQLEAYLRQGDCSGPTSSPSFDFEVGVPSFYNKGGGGGVAACQLPGTELQLMFGGMQRASVTVKSLDLKITPFEDCQKGCVASYVAVLEYRFGDNYEFDAGDAKQGLFDSYARNLELCGASSPFQTEIVMEEPVDGQITITEKDECEDPEHPGDPDDPWPVQVVASLDPNDMIGPGGVGDDRWIARGVTLPYTIRFENDPKKASAPAQTVTVTQVLDPDFDARTFRLGRFGFGSFTFDPPANSAFYSTRLDVRDSLGIFVDVNAGIDLVGGELFWNFRSIDPVGGDLPSNPLAGFLPVDDASGHGQGFVSYVGRAKASTKTGDEIHAVARIVFDQNEPIDTPEIFNTVDADPPRTRVEPLPAVLDTTVINLSWAGGDSTGSGVETWSLYGATDDGPFELWQDGIEKRSLAVGGEYNHSYRFLVQAVDRVGNREAAKTVAEATVRLDPDGAGLVPGLFAVRPNFPNPFATKTVIGFDLPRPGRVELRVFDPQGRLVVRRIRGALAAGSWQEEVDMTGRASGVYFAELWVRFGDGSEARKVRKMVMVH